MLCPVLWCSDSGGVLVARAAIPLKEDELNRAFRNGSLSDWDYSPWDREESPFEYKPSDWGWLPGCPHPIALDYSTPALTTPDELQALL